MDIKETTSQSHTGHAETIADEIENFESVAHDWWDSEGPFKPLHDINPSRCAYIARHIKIKNKRIVDIGCGGGLLCEAMAKSGGDVTGLEPGEKALHIATEHAHTSGLKIEYANTPAHTLAQSSPHAFDVVTCMEVLEHVPDPNALVAACTELVRQDGYVFFSTINRTPGAWLVAIVGGEYITRTIPKGTHHYRQFIKPAELARMAMASGLEVVDISGLHYDPVGRRCIVDKNIGVNYLMCCRMPKHISRGAMQ